MEVACSLDDVARVLADNGYHFSDDACFSGASDLPAMLGALDSPDSFPESPCSDEDIARVLDITRMSSPSLLESCAHETFTSHIQRPSSSNESYRSAVKKTRDPCITNAVLQNPILNVVPSFPNRDSQSLDIFSIAFNSSFSDDNHHFSSLVNPKENDFLNSHTNSTYFNSSLALSPVSDTDTSLSISADTFAKHSQHFANHFDIQLDNNLQQQVSFDLSSSNESMCVDNPNPQTLPTPEPHIAAPPTKRKRRRKASHITPKSKRKKQDNTNNTFPKPKANKKDTNTKQKQINETSLPAPAPKLKKSKASTKYPKTKDVIEKTPDSSTELPSVDGSKQTTSCDLDITKDTRQEGTADTEIGSTNGVTEEPKGPRRSSRSTRNTENYNFRLSSIVKRVETERKQQEPKQPKGKVKPPPLSKYRRRTANARERDRMKEINDAYDDLKNALPAMEPDDGKQKITKFAILKFTLNYISSLQEMLGYDTLPQKLNENISSDYANSSSANTSVNEFNGDNSGVGSNPIVEDYNCVLNSSNVSCTGGNGTVFEQENSEEESMVL